MSPSILALAVAADQMTQSSPTCEPARSGNTVRMATYRVLNPTGDVVDTKDIESADDAHAWFVDQKADNSELGWRMEVETDDGGWAFFDDTEGDRR